MNIIQQQEALKGLSDDQIVKEMQQPSGKMPLFLVTTEAKRRADLRQRYQAEQAEPPQTTVQEDLLRAIMNQEAAPVGIGAAVGPGSPQQQLPQPQALPQPQTMPQLPQPQASIIAGQPQPAPANVVQPQGFADGGSVRGFANGKKSYDYYGAPGSLAGSISNATGWVGDKFSHLAGAPLAQEKKRQEALLARQAAKKDALAELRLSPRIFNPKSGVDAYPTLAPPITNGIMAPPRLPTGAEDAGFIGSGIVAPDANQALRSAMINRKKLGFEVDQGIAGLPPFKAFAKPAPTPPGVVGTQAQRDAVLIDPDKLKAKDVNYMEVPGAHAYVERKLKLDKIGDPTALAEANLAKLRAADKANDPYAKQETRLEDRGETLDENARQNKWMSLAKAGFAIAGGKSQHAMENIAKGATEGLDEFTEGQNLINARRDKLSDAQDALTGLRVQRDMRLRNLAEKQAAGTISATEANNAKESIIQQAHVAEQNIQIGMAQSARDEAKSENVRRDAAAQAAAAQSARLETARAQNAQTVLGAEQRREDQAFDQAWKIHQQGRSDHDKAQQQNFDRAKLIVEAKAKRWDKAGTREMKLRELDSLKERAEISAGTLSSTAKTISWVLNLPDGTAEEKRFKAQAIHLIDTNGAKANATAHRVWEKAQKAADITFGANLPHEDKQRIMRAYIQLGGNQALLPVLMRNLGATAPSRGVAKFGSSNVTNVTPGR